MLQPDADLSYEVSSPVPSEASEGWSGAADTRDREDELERGAERGEVAGPSSKRQRIQRNSSSEKRGFRSKLQEAEDPEEQQQREERVQVQATRGRGSRGTAAERGEVSGPSYKRQRIQRNSSSEKRGCRS